MLATDGSGATVIRSPRAKMVLYLIGSLVFVAIAAKIVSETDSAAPAWLFLGFSGLFSIVFLWLLFRPLVLTLDRSGFVLTGGLLWTPRRRAWRDIEGFSVYRLGAGAALIAYNLVPGARADSPLRRLWRRGGEATLPNIWPGSAEELVEKLNEYRKRALTTHA